MSKLYDMALKMLHSKDFKTRLLNFKQVLENESYPFILAGESALENNGINTDNDGEYIFLLTDKKYNTPLIRYYDREKYNTENLIVKNSLLCQDTKEALLFIKKIYNYNDKIFKRKLEYLIKINENNIEFKSVCKELMDEI